ncbi:MAG: rhodanese-like domain-containing protein [Bacteroidetes bacterium]|nr:rhodanese-like domain-containing protein [Bacteroidota bacterium]
MKKKSILILAGIVTFCLFWPLASIGADKTTPKKYPDFVKEMVVEVKKSLPKSIDMAAFTTVVDNKSYDLIVDVREPNEFEVGHVAGAINIPRGVAEFKIWKKVGFPDNTDTGKNIYIYCRTGGRAALTTKALQDLGFTNLVHVNMKIAEWKEAGNPTVAVQ